MNKLFNIAKVTGFVALLAFMFIGAMPSSASAKEALAAAPARDCDLTNNACFARVGDDGSIIVYYLGNLLN